LLLQQRTPRAAPPTSPLTHRSRRGGLAASAGGAGDTPPGVVDGVRAVISETGLVVALPTLPAPHTLTQGTGDHAETQQCVC